MSTSTLSERSVEKSTGKVITIHSNRGGVGKTLVAVNLAMAYAKRGRNVCLIDLDFRAPSLSSVIQVDPNFWVNDFLDDHGKIWDALVDVSSKYGVKGKLFVGLADSSLEAIRNMAYKDKQWEMNAFRKLVSLKSELSSRNIEYIFLDTSPGMLYSSVNAIACSDMVVVVTTAEPSEAEATKRAIAELYKAFEKPTFVFMNKVMPIVQWKESEKKTISEKFSARFNAPVVAVVPCYCDVLNSSRTTIYTLEMPEHPFSKTIYDVADKLSMMKA